MLDCFVCAFFFVRIFRSPFDDFRNRHTHQCTVQCSEWTLGTCARIQPEPQMEWPRFCVGHARQKRFDSNYHWACIWVCLPFFLCVLTNEWSWSSDAGNGSHSNVDINLVVSDREISHIHNSDALYLLPAIIIINAAARQRYFFFCEPLMLLAAYCWNPLNGISDSSTWRDACKLIWSRYEREKNKKKK